MAIKKDNQSDLSFGQGVVGKVLDTVASPLLLGVGVAVNPKFGKIIDASSSNLGRNVQTNEYGAQATFSEDGRQAIIPHGGKANIMIQADRGKQVFQFVVIDHPEFMFEEKLNPGWAQIIDKKSQRFTVNQANPIKKLLKDGVAFTYLPAQSPNKQRKI